MYKNIINHWALYFSKKIFKFEKINSIFIKNKFDYLW